MARLPHVGDVVRCRRCAVCVEVVRIETYVQITEYADGTITESLVDAVCGCRVPSSMVADVAVPWCAACGTAADVERERRAADPTVN